MKAQKLLSLLTALPPLDPVEVLYLYLILQSLLLNLTKFILGELKKMFSANSENNSGT